MGQSYLALRASPTVLDDCLRMLQACYRKRMSGLHRSAPNHKDVSIFPLKFHSSLISCENGVEEGRCGHGDSLSARSFRAEAVAKWEYSRLGYEVPFCLGWKPFYRMVQLIFTQEIEVLYMLFDRSLSISCVTSLKQSMEYFNFRCWIQLDLFVHICGFT